METVFPDFDSFSRMAFCWGETSCPGQLWLLEGEMGTGKTTFTQQFCKGAGSKDRIHSPTFRLVHRYFGRCPIFHLDLYRLDTIEAAILMDVERYLEDLSAIVIVEWPQIIYPLITRQAKKASFFYHNTPLSRRIVIEELS